MNKELLQQALDALENHSGNYKLTSVESAVQLAAVIALKNAIAQSVEAQLVPLTDKQIYDLWPSECMAFCEEAAEFARAIEAHRGIKPAGTQPIRTPK